MIVSHPEHKLYLHLLPNYFLIEFHNRSIFCFIFDLIGKGVPNKRTQLFYTFNCIHGNILYGNIFQNLSKGICAEKPVSWNFLWIRSTYCFKYFQCKIFWLFYVHCWFKGFIQDRVIKATIFAAKHSTSSHCTKNEVFLQGFLRICLHLLKKSLVENFIFCAVSILYFKFLIQWFYWADIRSLKPILGRFSISKTLWNFRKLLVFWRFQDV